MSVASRISSRLSSLTSRAPALALALVLAAAACQDSISGPSEQVGPPLLDVDIQPAGAPALPAASFALNATRDTLRVTLDSLPPLPTGFAYQVFLVDSVRAVAGTASDAVVAAGAISTVTTRTRPVTRDSAAILIDTTSANAGQFDQTGLNRHVVFTITNAALGDQIANYTHVAVMVTGSPQPGGAKFSLDSATRKGFLWARYRTGTTFVSSGSLRLGTFAVSQARRINFIINGTANGAFFGNQFRANFSNLLRPPEGFQYVGWLTDARTGRQLRLGPLMTPVPDDKPLTDADVGTNPFLTNVAIFQSQLRAQVDSADNFTRFSLVLEPKGAAASAAPGNEVFGADVPPSVASRHPASATLTGTVTQAGAPLANATIYLTGQGLAAPVKVTTTDAQGKFRINNVNAGPYTLHVIPAGATQDATPTVNFVMKVVLQDGQLVTEAQDLTIQIT